LKPKRFSIGRIFVVLTPTSLALVDDRMTTAQPMSASVSRFTWAFTFIILASVLVLSNVFATDSTVAADQSRDRPAIAVHPENPKYFLFRGKPAFLLTASEHYGSLLNRPFDYRKYLDDLVDKRMSLTRTFLLYRELASSKNPASPCKPRPQDYIAPWPRTGPGLALDGRPKFDLDAWNPEFFDRLHRFLDLACQRGIVVELTLLSNTYAPPIWALNPLRAENNLQGVGKIEWPEYISLKDPAVVARQVAHVRKIIQETALYDNVYYEICNEPGGGLAGHVSAADVDQWQAVIAKVVREEMSRAGREHLVFGSPPFGYIPIVSQELDRSFDGNLFDAVNVHPLPNLVLSGRSYQLGNFMSKELQLAELIDFGRATWARRKPCVWDEDNAASMFQDEVGWTIHRKRAWVALLSGSHYDEIDFSIQIGKETGTPESSSHLRKWFRILSQYFASIDYLHAAPAPEWIRGLPEHTVAAKFAVENLDYNAYLADKREVADRTAGEPVSGNIELSIPPGRFRVRYFSPVDGSYHGEFVVVGGKPMTVDLPAFRHDIVVRAVLSK
jgi:hypothetical protein